MQFLILHAEKAAAVQRVASAYSFSWFPSMHLVTAPALHSWWRPTPQPSNAAPSRTTTKQLTIRRKESFSRQTSRRLNGDDDSGRTKCSETISGRMDRFSDSQRNGRTARGNCVFRARMIFLLARSSGARFREAKRGNHRWNGKRCVRHCRLMRASATLKTYRSAWRKRIVLVTTCRVSA